MIHIIIYIWLAALTALLGMFVYDTFRNVQEIHDLREIIDNIRMHTHEHINRMDSKIQDIRSDLPPKRIKSKKEDTDLE